MQVLVGARLFDGDGFLDDCALVLEGGRIAAITSHAARPKGVDTRDLGGGLLAPGFIDVQVNGGGGALFNDEPSADAVIRIAEAHRRYGSVGILATLVTDAPEKMNLAIAAVREARRRSPAVIGVHLEGPFLDPRRKGAHEADFFREMTAADVETIAGADCGAVMTTLAPNRVPPTFVSALARRGVLVSLGHSDATFAEAMAAVAAGARAFTHLFNAMRPMTAREPGMVGAALADSSSYVGVIADGFHVHPATLRVALAAKRGDRIMLVTDAMPPAAGGPDTFALQGRRIETRGGRLTLEDGTLAGSRLTMDEALRNVVNALGVDLADALRMASLNPAAFLRRDRELGRLAPGALASLVHLDQALHVRETWIAGR